MLVEVIIVTVVVASIMTSLYVVFNRVYNAYDKKSNYTNIDAIYALKMIEDYMIDTEVADDFMFDNLINTNTTFTNINCETGNTDFDTYCNSVFSEYNINSIYFVKNDEDSLEDLKENVTNQTFKDYIDYLINIGIHTTNFLEDNKKYKELLITETYTIDNEGERNILNKYAYLPTKIITE